MLGQCVLRSLYGQQCSEKECGLSALFQNCHLECLPARHQQTHQPKRAHLCDIAL